MLRVTLRLQCHLLFECPVVPQLGTAAIAGADTGILVTCLGFPPFQTLFQSTMIRVTLLLMLSILWRLRVPLFSISGTGISTCFKELLKQHRNSCGKWTCALLFCVSEIACL